MVVDFAAVAGIAAVDAGVDPIRLAAVVVVGIAAGPALGFGCHFQTR